jgi:hypothetical protein
LTGGLGPFRYSSLLLLLLLLLFLPLPLPPLPPPQLLLLLPLLRCLSSGLLEQLARHLTLSIPPPPSPQIETPSSHRPSFSPTSAVQ